MDARADRPRATGGTDAEIAPVFLLSVRYRAEVQELLESAGHSVISARRATDAQRKFEQSPALIALVDLRGAIEPGLQALRTLAPVIEKRGAALVALLSRHDAGHLDDIYAAGATHFVTGGRRRNEVADSLRFADRYVRRLRASEAAAAVASAQARLSTGARWSWRKGDTSVSVSPAFAAMLGETAGTEVIPAASAFEHIEAADRDNFVRGIMRVMRGGLSGDLDHRMVIDGAVHRITHRVRATRDADGRLNGLAATVEDLDAAMLERRLSAHFDTLTGLANAAFARDWIDQLLGGRSECEPACIVLMLSLSRFEGINAAYGRTTADALLQAVARRIRRVAGADRPEAMLVARMAGAEFGVCFAGPVKLADVVLLAERLGAAFDQPFLVGGHVIHLACRIGIAVGEKDLDGADTLLRRASAALVQAKAGEPNRFEVFMGKGPDDLLARMASLGDDLRAALDDDGFDLLYQPQVDIATNRIVGLEALARWRHPQLGLLPPETLLGVAESAEVMGLLGKHLLLKALGEATRWPRRLRGLRLAINMTAEDMADPAFADDVMAALEETGFPPAQLTVEMTESNMMRDVELAARSLGALRHLGVAIAIDDFGTGYSSLAYLRALPLDYLKVDKRMVEDLFGSARDRVVVTSVVEMARSLGLKVVAEGVETIEQRDAAARAGCDVYQGYLCAPPLTPKALASLLKGWEPRAEQTERG